MAIFEPTTKRSAQGPLLLALAAIAAGGALIWWKTRPAELPPAPQAPVAAQAPATPAPPEAPPVSDETQQSLLQAVSASALVRAWLAQGDVVHRWAVVVSNLAEGETPRRQLPFLAPATPFSAQPSGMADIIAPASYQRYDAFADAVGTIDAAAFARAVHALHPALEAAYRALGYPAGSLDLVASKALRRIEDSPVETNPVLIDRKGQHWVFEAERLEAMGEVEKHLLRMGPRNTKILQEKAAALRTALGLPGVPLAGHGGK